MSTRPSSSRHGATAASKHANASPEPSPPTKPGRHGATAASKHANASPEPSPSALASDEAGSITGDNLIVSGGRGVRTRPA
ncbi:hypothetical protein [Streptomyces sp. NBC_01497]|uniref:hypothetical protein n=1 Tax=Streptomyces sp. NBC_01497 TaxID=2903885 RepID=UPI002E37050D|nr:hypothetical protein [Streptomyces sp. NBC_01497]